MDRRIKQLTFKPIKSPFGDDKIESEKRNASAIRKILGEGLGAKILDQLIIDMEYFRPDLPVSHEQMAFNAGKKYVISHILHALAAEYTTTTIEDNNYDD